MRVTLEIDEKLLKVAKYLWDNRQQIVENYTVFDYPDYGGLPKELSDGLSPDTVDAIQQEIFPSGNYFSSPALILGTYTFAETLYKLLKFDIMNSLASEVQ